MILRALSVATCLLLNVTSYAAEETLEVAGRRVALWSSPGGGPRPPVLIFSHGFHGCATQSRFLMNAFAAAGYLVLAPNHRDAVCNGGTARWMDRPTRPFWDFRNWTDATYRDRADDIQALVNALRTDERLRLRADPSRLGLAGHSLGGYTVLGLGGAWNSWKLDGVRAVLALSPYSHPFIAARTLGKLSAPVMYQGGTFDIGITPELTKRDGAYEQSSAPKYFVEFKGAGHLAWSDIRNVDHGSIAEYAVAFMDLYVKGAPADPLLTHPGAEVAALRFKAEAGQR